MDEIEDRTKWTRWTLWTQWTSQGELGREGGMLWRPLGPLPSTMSTKSTDSPKSTRPSIADLGEGPDQINVFLFEAGSSGDFFEAAQGLVDVGRCGEPA